MSVIHSIISENSHFSERRKISLYSDFRRLKDVNPEGFRANVSAWRSVLVEITARNVFPDKTLLVANGQLLDNLFDAKHGIPLALDVVIDEMVAEGALMPLSTYISRPTSIYYRPWFNINLSSMAQWALTKMGLCDPAFRSGSSGTLKDEKYVVIKQLNDYATRVLDCLRAMPGIGSVYSKSVFTKELFELLVNSAMKEKYGDDVQLSRTDNECILRYLSRDKRYISISDEWIIKIVDLYTVDKISEITERDRAVASLRSTIFQVSCRVDRLSNSIQSNRAKASRALEIKNKTVAKYALRSAKIEEHAQEKALEMLQNLETVLSKIDEASDQVDVVNALQSGVQLLGTLNETVGGAERVGDLMDMVKEKMEVTDVISRELSQLTTPIDDDELEEQLNLMLEEELTKLPKAPSKLPSGMEKVSLIANKQQQEDDMDRLAAALQDSSLEEEEPSKSPVSLTS